MWYGKENDIFKVIFNLENSNLEMDLNCKIGNMWAFAYLPIYTDEPLKL